MNNILPFPSQPGMAQQNAQGPLSRLAPAGPMQMIMNQVMHGFSPSGIVERIGGPQASQAKQIICGKSQAQLRDIAYNMARQRGIDLGELAAQMGMNLPR